MSDIEQTSRIDAKLYIAKVIDTDETKSITPNKEKVGRVRIRILPEFKDVEESLLPYARPFSRDGVQQFNPPAIGSYVYVLSFDTYWKGLFYLPYVFSDAAQAHDDIVPTITAFGADLTASDKAYPDFHYEIDEGGVTRIHNHETGVMGLAHPKGVTVLIDADGKVKVKTTTTDVQVSSGTGNIVVDAESGKLDFKNATTSLQNELLAYSEVVQGILSDLTAIPFNGTLNGAPVSGTLSYTGGAARASALIAIDNKIKQLLVVPPQPTP